MSYKDHKLAVRKNIEDLKKQPRVYKDKENLIDYFKKDKSRSNQKNNTLNTQTSLKVPFVKKTNTKTIEPLGECDSNVKKIRTQADTISSRKPELHIVKKQDFNMTMIPKKSQEKSQGRKALDNNSYFLTADVSSVLRAINTNNNYKLQASITRNKKPNMMTEDDIEKLFQKGSSKKRKTEQAMESSSKFQKKKPQIEQEVKQLRLRLDQQSKSKSKKKSNIFHTDPDNYHNQRKIQTMKLNIKQILEEESQTNKQKKDFAQSIKFLEIIEEPKDKLLCALEDDDLIKIQADPNIDKTAKFKEDFLVGKQIGQGAYASVRVAIYKPQNKKVAIKIYEKRKIKQIQRRKSVKRQIKILQKIDHKNILKIYDVIQTNNHVNIIMEYIPGISLNSHIKNQSNQKITQKEARRIFVPLIEAIKYLHDLSICHRDIKLQNVLLDNKTNPKLIDFGFSTCIQNQKKVRMFCGTPSYMAPEIVQKKEYKGTLADIWAIGVLLYVMFTGIFPFKGNTDKQLYTKISNADYPRLTGLSKSAQNIIQRMLTIDCDARITAAEILNHPWVTGKQSKPENALKESKDSKKNQPNDFGDKLEMLLKMTKYNNVKKESQNQHQLKYDQSKQRIGMAETYKDNLRNQLRKAKQNWSPKNSGSKPKTCTNRESTRIRFDLQQQVVQNEQPQQQLESIVLKSEKIIMRTQQVQERLTNKRYF